MRKSVFVLDTSYLLELHEVADNHSPDFAHRLKERFKEAVEADSRFYIPFPVLFEWANHIADIKNGFYRHRDAQKLGNLVAEIVQKTDRASRWQIWGAGQLTEAEFLSYLQALVSDYATERVVQRFGLTDTVIIQAVQRLKARPFLLPVHIWTKHRALKTQEPDPEADPLLE